MSRKHYKLSPRLVNECRNRDIKLYEDMTHWARMFLNENRMEHVQYYSEAGWVDFTKSPISHLHLQKGYAYRLKPGWNPLKCGAV